MENNNVKGHIAALFTVFVWGTTFISTKVLLKDFKPIEILFFRFLMGFIILNLIYPKRLHIKERKQEILFAGAGICGVTLYYLFENIALTYTMASNVSVILSVAPFFTAVFSYIFLKERKKTGVNFIMGFVLAIAGICLISFKGEGLKFNPIGDILALGAAMIWAMYSVITRKIGEYGYNIVQVTRRIFAYGLLFMIPFLFVFDFEPGLYRFADKVYTWNIIFLGLGASALCFVTWNMAVKILGAVKTSVYIYLSPVVTIVTAFIVLGERMTYMSIAGTVLTLGGLILSEKKSKKELP